MKQNVFDTFVWRCNKCRVWGAGSDGPGFECIPKCEGKIVKVLYADFWHHFNEEEKEGILEFQQTIAGLKEEVARLSRHVWILKSPRDHPLKENKQELSEK